MMPHTQVERGAIVTLGTEGNEITFANARLNDLWLDGDHWIDNTFTDKS